MTSNQELIGRDEINDLEAILSVTNTDADAVAHTVGANLDAIFTWDYDRSRAPLVKLYEKAKTSQWNATTDLDWSIEVDQEKVVVANMEADPRFFSPDLDLTGTPFAKWTDKEWIKLGI
ncbi:MAG TPA: ferritin-like domain-containing protein, partial [Acidimicrobiia bacterium]|nr:ferritin-like domain-containing protein [Acidimicrobiia bacterium]